MTIRISFRVLRSRAIFSAERVGLEALAEYLVKMMKDEPGLSQERILAQLTCEYNVDMAEMVTASEETAIAKGFGSGTTFLEATSKNLVASALMFAKSEVKRKSG
jgi:hypothetical protein